MDVRKVENALLDIRVGRDMRTLAHEKLQERMSQIFKPKQKKQENIQILYTTRKGDLQVTVVHRGQPIRGRKYETKRTTRKDDLKVTVLQRGQPIRGRKYETRKTTRKDDLKVTALHRV